MKCPKCSAENLADSSFCEECGASTPLLLLDRAELPRLQGNTAAHKAALRQAKGLFVTLGAPLRVQQIDALLQRSCDE